MLDIKRIRENPDELRDGLKRRYHDTAPVDALLACDQERRTLVTRVEELKSRRNAISREVGQKRKAGEDTTVLQNEVRAMGDTIAAMDQQIREVDERQSALLLSIPNIPCRPSPPAPMPIPTVSSASSALRRNSISRLSTTSRSASASGSSTCPAPRA